MKNKKKERNIASWETQTSYITFHPEVVIHPRLRIHQAINSCPSFPYAFII